MLTRKQRRQVRTLTIEEWVEFNRYIPDMDGRQMANARRRVAGRIADEMGVESVLGSFLTALAIKFAFNLLWRYFEDRLFTLKDLEQAGELDAKR